MLIFQHPATAALSAVRPAPLDPAAAWLECIHARLVGTREGAVEQLLGQHWPCHVLQAWPGIPDLHHATRLHSCVWYDLFETRFGIWWVYVVSLGWFRAQPCECSTFSAA